MSSKTSDLLYCPGIEVKELSVLTWLFSTCMSRDAKCCWWTRCSKYERSEQWAPNRLVMSWWAPLASKRPHSLGLRLCFPGLKTSTWNSALFSHVSVKDKPTVQSFLPHSWNTQEGKKHKAQWTACSFYFLTPVLRSCLVDGVHTVWTGDG